MDKTAPEMNITKMLKDAILDSELLLSYASEKGLEINPEHIKALVVAKKNDQNNSWNELDEINFWIAFQALSKAVQPVNIDSLRASAEPVAVALPWWQSIIIPKKRSKIARSVLWYRRFTLIAMIIMLAFQIYGIIGAALMAKVTSGMDRINQIAERTAELGVITQSNTEDRTAAMEKDNLLEETVEITQEVESSIQLMDDWLNFTANIWSRNTREISKSVASEAMDPSKDLSVGGISETSRNIVVISQAKSLLIILNQYVLPLLYGLIGGCAFVLRSLANETKRMTYTPTSNIEYGLRLHLGALAGLVIGFLWGDFQGKSFGVVESLSPLAVAFLAGYSVDFLFRMIDSVVGNIGKKEAAVAQSKDKEAAEKK